MEHSLTTAVAIAAPGLEECLALEQSDATKLTHT